jgi:hypothetical protein
MNCEAVQPTEKILCHKCQSSICFNCFLKGPYKPGHKIRCIECIESKEFSPKKPSKKLIEYAKSAYAYNRLNNDSVYIKHCIKQSNQKDPQTGCCVYKLIDVYDDPEFDEESQSDPHAWHNNYHLHHVWGQVSPQEIQSKNLWIKNKTGENAQQRKWGQPKFATKLEEMEHFQQEKHTEMIHWEDYLNLPQELKEDYVGKYYHWGYYRSFPGDAFLVIVKQDIQTGQYHYDAYTTEIYTKHDIFLHSNFQIEGLPNLRLATKCYLLKSGLAIIKECINKAMPVDTGYKILKTIFALSLNGLKNPFVKQSERQRIADWIDQ